MLEKIISYTLQRKGIAVLMALFIVVIGVYSFVTLPIDAFPDVTNIQVEIITHADGLSAVEIERSVTYPVETVLKGLPDIEQIRSVTKFGLSIVTVVFKDNVDIYFARQLIFERLGEVRARLPERVDVEMGPIATVMGEVYQYTLEGELPVDTSKMKEYLAELRTLQEWVVAPIFKNIAGINEINSFGGYFKEYQVTVYPDKLLKYSLSVEDVFTALENNNRNAGGNILENGSEQFIVRGVGMITDMDDIRRIVLKESGGTPVFIDDVADVKIGHAVRMGAAIINGGHETVGGIVMMLRGENSREVVNRVKDKVMEINTGRVLPHGIKIVPFYDRSEIIDSSVKTVTTALLEGSAFVLVILYILLRNFRGSFVVLLALPLSLLAASTVMRFTGIDANLMTLGGLAISIGMIVDAAIIQVENVQSHLSRLDGNMKKDDVILKAVLEVRKPSIYGELIIAITFIPILSLEGIEGKMFGPLAYTVGIAILASMFLSVFMIPALCALFLKAGKEKENSIIKTAEKFYMIALEYVMRKKTAALSTAGVLLLVALFLFTQLGTEFIPVMDEGSFDADIGLLPGVSLSKSIEINQLVSQKLKQFPELETVVARIGQTGVALDTRGVEKTGYVGILKPKEEWARDISSDVLIHEMRKSLESIPGLAFGFSQPIQCRIDELVAGTKAQLIVKLFGDDFTVLKQKSDEIARALSGVDGVIDLMTEKISGQPYLTISIDREKIARYGMNISYIQNIIEISISGKPATKLYEQNRSFNITVRLPENKRNSVESIGNMLIPAKAGMYIPLKQLAKIEMIEGPVQISRQDGIRSLSIELNTTGRDIGGLVKESKQVISDKVILPPGYYLTWGGQFENQQRATNKLLLIGPAVVICIFFLLYITFRSVGLASLVIVNLPFALIGGVFSLYISGLYLSVPASVGFIVLFGVAVLNGVVMTARIVQLRDAGETLEQAIKMGSRSRLRPVLMTALIAVCSLIPMLFASSPGSEIQKPLAVVVVGGLLSSTILTLFLLPVLYAKFERR